ncbi:lanthionine synthetase LanC family protein [Cytobacillus sp. IB215665]|uniref:lanthionine synthetase LanC family protein n=1 Tax=Cytobacillus sp. IB215665 TaxID=3097357 RepID=UPI002A0E826E|nr:lanthionine synthetase LanC family protein [Cytobacillus sp. IB215665]MDX8367123.1 lanthionine synthetase LanC family protein [Cytobacillus sp. IB215665]
MKIASNGYYKNLDGLCHGNFGTVELFLHYFELTRDSYYLNCTKIIANEVIKHSKSNNGYRVDSIDGFPNISLFNGLSGIGYQFLRIHSNNQVPSVLTMGSV